MDKSRCATRPSSARATTKGQPLRISIKSERDFWASVLFVAAGAGFGIGALNYTFGDSSRPGPGYFPLALGILLAVLGALVMLQSLTVETEDGEKVGRWAWKPLLWTLGSVVWFGLSLPVLGLVVALPGLVLIASKAGDEFHWRTALANGAVLTVGSWLVFCKALKLVIPLWPVFLPI